MKDNNTTNAQLENGSPAFAKPVLYEVPIYLALNSNRSDKQKNKKKKSGGNKFL